MSEELEKRASDADREQVVVRLRDASAEGRLTLEELADRTALAYRARSHAELEPLAADLPSTAASSSVARRRWRWLIGVFVPVRRAGRRAFAEQNVVISLFAPVRLDLRQAQLPSAEAVINVFIALRSRRRQSRSTSRSSRRLSRCSRRYRKARPATSRPTLRAFV